MIFRFLVNFQGEQFVKGIAKDFLYILLVDVVYPFIHDNVNSLVSVDSQQPLFNKGSEVISDEDVIGSIIDIHI